MRQNFKLKPSENFISTALLKNLIKTTDIPKAIIEETTSELWYETLNGVGKIEFFFFKILFVLKFKTILIFKFGK